MNPFFFGSSERQLFGVHHPPERGGVRDSAVLICPPFGAEHIAAHRALQQLAARLARGGFHVLRFDYSCTGDSAGDGEEARFDDWVADVGTAAQELRDTSGASKLSVVGLRLGATSAAVAAAAGGLGPLHACVLWEPIVDGDAYLQWLAERQADWVRRTYPKPKPQTLQWRVPEVLGFPLPVALQDALRAQRLTDLAASPAPRVLLVTNEGTAAAEPLRAALDGSGAAVELRDVAAEPCWVGHAGGTIALVPVEVQQSIAAWLGEAHG